MNFEQRRIYEQGFKVQTQKKGGLGDTSIRFFARDDDLRLLCGQRGPCLHDRNERSSHQLSSRGYLRDLRFEVVVMDRHPELRRLAKALLDAVIADQEQTAKVTEEKPKEAQYEDHT